MRQNLEKQVGQTKTIEFSKGFTNTQALTGHRNSTNSGMAHFAKANYPNTMDRLGGVSSLKDYSMQDILSDDV